MLALAFVVEFCSGILSIGDVSAKVGASSHLATGVIPETPKTSATFDSIISEFISAED